MYNTMKITVIALFALCTGCATLADYVRPEMPVSAEWKEADSSYTLSRLDEFIRDARLNMVITLALENNRDLRSQIASVEAVRAGYKIQRSALFPSINAEGSASRSATTGKPDNSFGLEVGLVTYELDLFGKNRSLKESALEQYLSAAETANAARISLIAETVNAWASLAADKEMLQLALNMAESAKISMELTRKRYELGVTSILDVYQAETVYQEARADASNYTTLVEQDLNALELLCGGIVATELLPENFEDSNSWFGTVSAGLSSSVLLNRPDVAAAEHTLLAGNADIGAARAAFFPSISLVGAAGYASSELNTLFSGGKWSFGGGINLPIFTGGRNKANLEQAKHKYDAYIADYEKTIQTAFKEVADALARKKTVGEQIQAQQALADISRKSYELSEARYSTGVDGYLDVLISQRSYYGAEQALINIKLTDISNRITLYKALGGGQS